LLILRDPGRHAKVGGGAEADVHLLGGGNNRAVDEVASWAERLDTTPTNE